MNNFLIEDLYLEHYGVKGMKWGVRHEEERVSRVKKVPHASLSQKRLSSLEKKYLALGYSRSAARKAAQKRLKVEKALAVTAGVSVAAIGAYALSKHVSEKYIDKTLKSGIKLRTITDSWAVSPYSKEELKESTQKAIERGLNPQRSFLDERQRFYASYKKSDTRRYFTDLGARYLQKGEIPRMVTTTPTKNIKVASLSNAKKTFSSLYKNDSSFRSAIDNSIFRVSQDPKITDKQFKALKKGMRDLAKGKMTDDAYTAFNMSLANRSENASPSVQKFYDAMRKAGYSAITDLNDRKISGYRTKAPVIVFGKENIRTIGPTSITDASRKGFNVEMNREKMINRARQGHKYLRNFGIR